MTTDTTTKSRKFPLILGIALIAAIWIATFIALAVMQPDLKMRMIVLAVGAGATELVLYAGAAWFGINLFRRFGSFFSKRGN